VISQTSHRSGWKEVPSIRNPGNAKPFYTGGEEREKRGILLISPIGEGLYDREGTRWTEGFLGKIVVKVR